MRFDRRRITSASCDDYPMLRFSEMPTVEVKLIQRPQAASLGAGEAAQGPTAAAIGNAVFDALGVRARSADHAGACHRRGRLSLHKKGG